MKKVVCIYFLALYTASLSGMVWAKDCKAFDFVFTASNAKPTVCHKGDGHASDVNGHPLQHFCKLMETHKEVLVKGKVYRTGYSPLVTAINSFGERTFELLPQTIFSSAHPVCDQKQYLVNRVLLI